MLKLQQTYKTNNNTYLKFNNTIYIYKIVMVKKILRYPINLIY